MGAVMPRRATESNIRWLVLMFGCLLAAAGPAPAQRVLETPVLPALVMHGHQDTVISLAFFPDGKRAVSGSRDRTIKTWDLANGRVLHSFEGHEGPVTAVAVSHDGTQIASGSTDKTIRVWDVHSGKQIAQLEGHTGPISCLAYDRRGHLVSGAADGVRVWDVSHEKLLSKRLTHFRTDAITLTPEGSRAAVTEDDGNTYVFDVASGKRLALFGRSVYRPDRVWITPDGKQVYYQRGNGVAFARGDVSGGNSIDLAGSLQMPNALAFSPDQKFVFAVMGAGADVINANTFQTVGVASSNFFNESIQSIAISPDGHTVLLGSGGNLINGSWSPGRLNAIAVVRIRDFTQPVPTGPVAGVMSWETIPARVRTLSGGMVPLHANQWECRVPFVTEVFHRLDEKLDGVIVAGAVLLHREPGILDEVLADPEAGFDQIAWDGKYIWVNSRYKGLWVLDHSGKLRARVGTKDGLPEGIDSNYIHALEPGRLLVAQTTPPRPDQPGHGWCAAVQMDDRGAAHVNVFITEANLGPQWKPGAKWHAPFLRPLGICEPLNDGAHREVWVMCSQTGQSQEPIIRIDPHTLGFSLYNLWQPHDGEQEPDGMEIPRSFNFRSAPCLVTDHSALGDVDQCVRKVPMGPQQFDFAHAQTIFNWSKYGAHQDVLEADGKLYYPGPHWFRIDRKSLRAEYLGPGLRLNGQLVSLHIAYAVSAHFGLCGVSATDGCFYRFSVDPAHPLATRGTLDPVGADTAGATNRR